MKKAQIADIFIKKLKFQVVKKPKPKTDLKSIIQEKYHDLLDVFSKKDSDLLLSYKKYDYKVILEKELKYSLTHFYKILLAELDIVKCYLDSHLANRFIQISSAPYLSLILVVKKPRKRI